MNIGEYSPMFTEPEVNNCFSTILRGQYQELQNNGLKHKTKKQRRNCAYTYAAVVTCTSIVAVEAAWPSAESAGFEIRRSQVQIPF